jgi:hypothetical protein
MTQGIENSRASREARADSLALAGYAAVGCAFLFAALELLLGGGRIDVETIGEAITSLALAGVLLILARCS